VVKTAAAADSDLAGERVADRIRPPGSGRLGQIDRTDLLGERMTLSARTLNRTTLQRQMLLQRESLPVPEAVRRLMALQAQHAASPYVALWNRLEEFDPAAMDEAFVARDLVKATLLRLTLHAVHGDDYATFREAMESRIRSGWIGEERFQQFNLAAGGDLPTLLSDLLAFTEEPRTGAEVDAWLEPRLGADPDPELVKLLRGYAPLVHAPLGQTWMFGQRASWIAPPTAPNLDDAEAESAALAEVIRRFLAGFGPATVPDMATFTVLKRSQFKDVLATMDDLVQLDGPGRAPYYDLPGMELADEGQAAPPRLMAMWDSVLLANHDRSRVLPPDYRKLVIRVNGDVLPTVLVDGYVAGLWRTVDEGVQVMAFHDLADETWSALEGEARSLIAMLADREPGVYRRYDHWWKRLPDFETRVLAGE
jgi:hypothetical protein